MKATLLTSVLALFATSLAGCTGQFDVKQTEPLRIQIDGAPQESRIAASDSGSGTQDPDKSEFRIEGSEEFEKVTVVVEITRVEGNASDGNVSQGNATQAPNETAENTTAPPVVVMVIVEDRDNGQRLAERRVEAENQSAQVELDIDVKGRNNVVIVTQAVQGIADVNVAARGGGSTMETASPSPGYTTPAP